MCSSIFGKRSESQSMEVNEGRIFPKYQLPKCIFPSGIFPNVQFFKRQLPKSFLTAALGPKPVLATELGPLPHLSRRTRPSFTIVVSQKM